VKKQEAEEFLNKVFNVSVKWSKLSSEEITQILTVLANPSDLIKRLGGVPKEEFKEEARKDLVKTFFDTWEGPIVSILRDFMRGLDVKKEKENIQHKA
jgi:hypothetical protein